VWLDGDERHVHARCDQHEQDPIGRLRAYERSRGIARPDLERRIRPAYQ
jgi:hypothetical protein